MVLTCSWLGLRHGYCCFLYRYLITVILLWKLTKKVDLLPPSVKHMQFGRFLKNGKGITLLKEMLYQKLIHIVYNLNIF